MTPHLLQNNAECQHMNGHVVIITRFSIVKSSTKQPFMNEGQGHSLNKLLEVSQRLPYKNFLSVTFFY